MLELRFATKIIVLHLDIYVSIFYNISSFENDFVETFQTKYNLQNKDEANVYSCPVDLFLESEALKALKNKTKCTF